MSKSMAIDGVMKIFLMVAVIIVGMSFLMKAFGIDLIGWLQGMLGGIGVLGEGRFLYFKVDPGDGNEFFAAYLSTDPIQKIEHTKLTKFQLPLVDNYFAYFMTHTKHNDLLEDCVLYTVDEESKGASDFRDKAFVYYIFPGTTIQDGCNSLSDCLLGRYIGSCTESKKDTGNCFPIKQGDLKKCYDEKKGEFSTVNCICGVGLDDSSRCDSTDKNKREVESKPIFVENKRTEGCELKNGVPKERSKCNLLTDEETNFRLKYGLVCAGGKWRVCKQDSKEQFTSSITAGGKTYKCGKGDANIYVWSEEPTSSAPAVAPTQSGPVKCSAPKKSEPTCVSAQSLMAFNWEIVPNAKKYRIEWCPQGVEFGHIDCSSETSAIAGFTASVKPSTSYNFRVWVSESSVCIVPGEAMTSTCDAVR